MGHSQGQREVGQVSTSTTAAAGPTKAYRSPPSSESQQLWRRPDVSTCHPQEALPASQEGRPEARELWKGQHLLSTSCMQGALHTFFALGFLGVPRQPSSPQRRGQAWLEPPRLSSMDVGPLWIFSRGLWRTFLSDMMLEVPWSPVSVLTGLAWPSLVLPVITPRLQIPEHLHSAVISHHPCLAPQLCHPAAQQVSVSFPCPILEPGLLTPPGQPTLL
jgi:hypothetical protein